MSPETPLSEVKDMLLQLKQAGLSVNDLIKLKQGNLGWNDVEKRSTKKKEEEQVDDLPSPPKPQTAAAAMQQIFEKRAAAAAPKKEEVRLSESRSSGANFEAFLTPKTSYPMRLAVLVAAASSE